MRISDWSSEVCSSDLPAQPSSLGWLDVYWLLAALAFGVCALLFFSRLDESAARPSPRRPAEDFAEMIRLAARPLVLVFVLSAFQIGRASCRASVCQYV